MFPPRERVVRKNCVIISQCQHRSLPRPIVCFIFEQPDIGARDALSAPAYVPCAAASVTATLHYNATVAPSDFMIVLAEKLAGLSAPDLLNEESSVQINAPENPPAPILVPEVWYTALAHCKVSLAPLT